MGLLTGSTGGSNDQIDSLAVALNQQITDLAIRLVESEKVVDRLAQENYDLTKRIKDLERRCDQHMTIGDVSPHTLK